MHSLRSILESIRHGDYLQTVDLREAYSHVPIHPLHSRYLRFEYNNMHFQYCAMPFGLSSAPRTFTKLVAVVAATIRSRSIRLLCYLDDVLVMSTSPSQAMKDMGVVLQVFQAHVFSINHRKSHLTPTTRLQHLGAVIDSQLGQVFLSPDRIHDIRAMVEQILSQ